MKITLNHTKNQLMNKAEKKWEKRNEIEQIANVGGWRDGEPTRWQNLPSGYQKIRTWWLGEWAECNEVWIILGKKCESVTTGLVQTGPWKKSPSFVWLHCDSLTEQVDSIKELGDHVTNLRRLGAPGSGLVAYLFDKHTPGRQYSELSLKQPSHSHGSDSPGYRSSACMLELPSPFL